MSVGLSSRPTDRAEIPPTACLQQGIPGSRRKDVCHCTNPSTSVEGFTYQQNQILKELERIILDKEPSKSCKAKSKKHASSRDKPQNIGASNLIEFDNEELAWLGQGNIKRLIHDVDFTTSIDKKQFLKKPEICKVPTQRVTDITDQQPETNPVLQKARRLLRKADEDKNLIREQLDLFTISPLCSISIPEPANLPRKSAVHAAREAQTQTSARSVSTLKEDKDQSSASASSLASLQLVELVEHLLKSELELV